MFLDKINVVPELPENAKICIYGTGARASSAKDFLTENRPDVEIVYFIDSFKSGVFEGKEIIQFDQIESIKNEYNIILIASILDKEIENNLQTKGITNYKVFEILKDFSKVIRSINTKFIEHSCCPVCYSKNIASKNENDKNIYTCSNCTHSFKKRVMSLDDTVKNAYQGIEYWEKDRSHQNIYKLDDKSQWDIFVKARLELFDKFNLLDGYIPNETKIFELGCSEGKLLHVLKQKGYDVLGCEVNSEIVEQAVKIFNISIINDCFENVNLESNSINLIYSFHVLEHLITPRDAIEKCAKSLKNGGNLCVYIPIDDKEENNIDHYHFFTTESLKYLFDQYFEDVKYSLLDYATANNNTMSSIIMVGTKNKMV